MSRRAPLILIFGLLVPFWYASAAPTAASPQKGTVAAPSAGGNQQASSSSYVKTPNGIVQINSLNGITQTAAKAGVRTCLESVEKVSNFMIANSRSRWFVFLPPANADQQVTSASFELEMPDRSVAYASMSAAPTSDGSCDSLYEAVTYWAAPCADVAAKRFPQAKLVGALQQQILVLQGGPQLRIFLMPAGVQGCVAIKKEVIY